MNGEEGTVMGAPVAGAVEQEVADAATAVSICRALLGMGAAGPREYEPGWWMIDTGGGKIVLTERQADLLTRLKSSGGDGP